MQTFVVCTECNAESDIDCDHKIQFCPACGAEVDIDEDDIEEEEDDS